MIVMIITRLLMSRVSDTDIEVTLMRGGKVGDKCFIILGTSGILDQVSNPVRKLEDKKI